MKNRLSLLSLPSQLDLYNLEDFHNSEDLDKIFLTFQSPKGTMYVL